MSRRVVLQAGALAGAAGLAAGLEEPRGLVRRSVNAVGNLVADVTRREDQLSLRFEFVNLKLLKAGESGPGQVGQARLVRVAAQPAYVIVHFGPQAVGEFAHDESNESALPPVMPPVAAAPAAATRLAFAVPAGMTSVPFTIQDLLAWHMFEPSVVPTAAVDATATRPVPVEPSATQTSIAAPWALVLSPHSGAAWAHAANLESIPPDGRTELWHTRLAVRKGTMVDEVDDAGRTVRAVWTPGFQRLVVPPSGYPAPPGRTSLTPYHRWEIVRLSSDWNMKQHGSYYVPQPISVDRLALSSLGAWLHTEGRWPDVTDDDTDHTFDVSEWVHRAAMGRDSYVRVVTKGFLFPTRHAAAMIITTERRFGVVTDTSNPQQHGRPVAYLSQKVELVPRERTRTYPDPAGRMPHGGREMPFKQITILTRMTPRILAPDNVANTSTQIIDSGTQQPYYEKAFWPRVATGASTSEDFKWLVRATDAEGRSVRMLMPLVFVALSQSGDRETVEDVIAAYESSPDRVTIPLHGQRVALAAFAGGAPGECAYPLANMTFGASLPNSPDGPMEEFTEPRFFPRMRRAKARLDAVERVAGGSYGVPTVTLHPAWLQQPDNSAGLFARVDPPIDLGFGADASGGVVTPSMRITGLSARTGPIGGDLSGAQAPAEFDPAAFFAGAAPKILGGISLLDVIDGGSFTAVKALGSGDTDGGLVPRLVTVPVPGGVETSLTWRPNLGTEPTGVFVKRDSTALVLRAKTLVRADGTPPTTEVSGEITDFEVVAIGSAVSLCIVDFRRLAFVSTNGSKPDIDADIASVRFDGILAFVSKLQEFLGSMGQSGQSLKSAGAGPPANGGFVEVTTAGIRVGYGVTLPPVPLGAFSLENIAIGSSLAIPFDGTPARVRFAFAERDKPFSLTVAIFGGGGFVGVAFGLDRFELFEASLEFGAKFAFDIGVASGGVSAVAGIYLAISATGGELTGYLRINGELEIIGLVHLAIEFYLGLTYDTGTGEVWGEASVTVEVDVLVFSGSVTLGPVRKQFAGGGGSSVASSKAASKSGRTAAVGGPVVVTATPPPSFADLMTPADWDEYRALFAPAAFA